LAVSPACHAVSGSTVIEPRSAFAEEEATHRFEERLYRVEPWWVLSGNKVLQSSSLRKGNKVLLSLRRAAEAAAGCPAFLA